MRCTTYLAHFSSFSNNWEGERFNQLSVPPLMPLPKANSRRRISLSECRTTRTSTRAYQNSLLPRANRTSLSERATRTSTRAYQNSLLLLLFLSCCTLSEMAMAMASAQLYTFEVTHRFSDKARHELRARHGDAFRDWPQHGTAEFHSMLFLLDLLRHRGRVLADAPLMASSASNLTAYNQHDGLQYTYIELGTPSQTYFVALDTGSDLLWLPCAHCVACAPSLSTVYNTTFSVYDSAKSSSYARVTCTSPYCVDLTTACASDTAQCPYHLQYLSPVSTEGYLVADVMYLIPHKGGSKTAVQIVFGCGTNQTGAFLSGATVPNGLLGLGMRNIAVPSILARARVMADSFSMCFDHGSGSGRLVFGDRGSPKAHSTPIITRISTPFYWVGLSYVLVGGVPVKTMTMAIFDTGTTYTYLSTSAYLNVMAAVDQAIPYKRVASPSESFDHCYSPPNVDDLILPTLTLRFTGGAKLQVLKPYAVIADRTDNLLVLCLTLVDSKSEYSIIGHNFMFNYSIAFDRVKNKITWIQVPSCSNYRTSFGSKTQLQPTWLAITVSTLCLLFIQYLGVSELQGMQFLDHVL